MLIVALCVPVSAADITETAKAIDSGKKVSFTTSFTTSFTDELFPRPVPKDYKIELSKKGTLKLEVTSAASILFVQVLDSEGSELMKHSEATAKTGRISSNEDGIVLHWNSSVQKSKAVLKYSLKKGTYYVRLYASQYGSVVGKTSVSFTYPQAEKAKSAEITSFAITLEEGDILQLDAILSSEGDVTWSSSKKSVASVSDKGKVTAKKKGTAVITAKTGSSSMKITIKVK